MCVEMWPPKGSWIFRFDYSRRQSYTSARGSIENAAQEHAIVRRDARFSITGRRACAPEKRVEGSTVLSKWLSLNTLRWMVLGQRRGQSRLTRRPRVFLFLGIDPEVVAPRRLAGTGRPHRDSELVRVCRKHGESLPGAPCHCDLIPGRRQREHSPVVGRFRTRVHEASTAHGRGGRRAHRQRRSTGE